MTMEAKTKLALVRPKSVANMPKLQAHGLARPGKHYGPACTQMARSGHAVHRRCQLQPEPRPTATLEHCSIGNYRLMYRCREMWDLPMSIAGDSLGQHAAWTASCIVRKSLTTQVEAVACASYLAKKRGDGLVSPIFQLLASALWPSMTAPKRVGSVNTLHPLWMELGRIGTHWGKWSGSCTPWHSCCCQ